MTTYRCEEGHLSVSTTPNYKTCVVRVLTDPYIGARCGAAVHPINNQDKETQS